MEGARRPDVPPAALDGAPRAPARRAGSRAAGLVPLVLLGAAALGVGVVRQAPAWLAGVALGAVLVLVVGWIVVSVLWPGRAERACPACGAEALARADPHETVGKRCLACDWSDPEESAWMLAEEEGAPLEPIVLRQRARRRRRGRSVDTHGARD